MSGIVKTTQGTALIVHDASGSGETMKYDPGGPGNRSMNLKAYQTLKHHTETGFYDYQECVLVRI